MNELYAIMLTDIEPNEFNKLFKEGKLPPDLTCLCVNRKPDFMDIMKLESEDIPDMSLMWRHVLKVENSEDGMILKEFVTSFMRSEPDDFGGIFADLMNFKK